MRRPSKIRPFLARITRRELLRASIGGGAAGLAGGLALKAAAAEPLPRQYGGEESPHSNHAGTVFHDANTTVGQYDTSAFDPMVYLRSFDYGKVTVSQDGRRLREYRVFAADRDIEIAPGVRFPAWTYNGTVPGPTLRATKGDMVRVHFQNAGAHPHTIHFHGFHPANMDGVFEVVDVGESFVYEFEADPQGIHLYHCHVSPLKRHIHKGLHGVFIVDPEEPRPPADELVMVMNAFDTDGDEESGKSHRVRSRQLFSHTRYIL